MEDKEVIPYLIEYLHTHKKANNNFLLGQQGNANTMAYFLGRMDEIDFIEGVLLQLLKEQEIVAAKK